MALSRDGLTIEQLETILNDHSQHLGPDRVMGLANELIEMKAARTKAPPDPLIAAATNAVGFTFDYNRMPADIYNFGPWSKQYVEGMDAIKMVLEFLQAQEGMDLFSGNRAAKQLYQNIIRSGVQYVIMNKG